MHQNTTFLLKQSFRYSIYWTIFIAFTHYLMFFSDGPYESGFISEIIGTLLRLFVAPLLVVTFCLLLSYKLKKNNIAKSGIVSFTSCLVILSVLILTTLKVEAFNSIAISLEQYTILVILTALIAFPVSFLAMYTLFTKIS
jgi:hypothetical protein